MPRPSGTQRAFALARNGDCLSIALIKKRLRDEGYNDDSVISPVVLRQLRRLLIDARREMWKRKWPRIHNEGMPGRKSKPDELQ